MSTSRTLSSVAITSGSFWKPSRGPTSRIRTSSMADEPSSLRAPHGRAVPIIGGTGALGFGLALRWARAGVPVVIGSRKQESADEAAARLREQVPDGAGRRRRERRGGQARPDRRADRPVPRAVGEPDQPARGACSPGQILVDATVPLAAASPARRRACSACRRARPAQQAQEMVPDGVHGRQRAPHGERRDAGRPRPRRSTRTSRSPATSATPSSAVAELIARIDGLRPINAGLLEAARLIEGLTPLLIGVNARHKTHAGISSRGCREPSLVVVVLAGGTGGAKLARRHARRGRAGRADRRSPTPPTTSRSTGPTSPPTPTSSPAGSPA